MTDDQVLALASGSLMRRAELPPGSIQREIQRDIFDGAMMELDRRLIRHILAKLELL